MIDDAACYLSSDLINLNQPKFVLNHSGTPFVVVRLFEHVRQIKFTWFVKHIHYTSIYWIPLRVNVPYRQIHYDAICIIFAYDVEYGAIAWRYNHVVVATCQAFWKPVKIH